MDSESFAAATRALRLKRRSFSKEITDIIKDAQSGECLSKEAFMKKGTSLNGVGRKSRLPRMIVSVWSTMWKKRVDNRRA